MKKFLGRCLLLAPLVCGLVAFNYIVDPARLFKRADYERRMVEALNSGAFLTHFTTTNFNDRAFQKLLIQSLTRKRDIGVLGSSRVMTISSAVFPGQTLLNNGVSAASFEDYVSLYEIYRDQGRLPSVMVIGVDPWIFNANNALVGWKQFGEEYYRRFVDQGPDKPRNVTITPSQWVPYQYQQLVSFSYFQAGVESLWVSRSAVFTKQQFSVAAGKLNDDYTIMPDGSRTWTEKERDATRAETRASVESEINDPRYVVHFVEIDPSRKEQFVRLLRSLQADGTRVVLYLPPYHPMLYDYYMHSGNLRIVGDVEAFLRQTAATEGVTVVGSYRRSPGGHQRGRVLRSAASERRCGVEANVSGGRAIAGAARGLGHGERTTT